MSLKKIKSKYYLYSDAFHSGALYFFFSFLEKRYYFLL